MKEDSRKKEVITMTPTDRDALEDSAKNAIHEDNVVINIMKSMQLRNFVTRNFKMEIAPLQTWVNANSTVKRFCSNRGNYTVTDLDIDYELSETESVADLNWSHIAEDHLQYGYHALGTFHGELTKDPVYWQTIELDLSGTTELKQSKI